MRIFAFTICILLNACAPDGHEYICTDSYDQRRACTKKEMAMIDGIRAIIGQIRHFDDGTINKNFEQAGDDLNVARVLFFGEEHTDIVSQIETLGAINALAQKGDKLLLEGADRKTKIEYNCGYYLILVLYVNWQWEKLGQPYNVANVQAKTEWQKVEKLSRRFWDTRFSYDISDLAISRLSCGFWDDELAIKETVAKNQVTAETLQKRNESMTEAIKSALDSGAERVIVNSGFRHMPYVDLFITRSINKEKKDKFPVELRRFYELVHKSRNKSLGGDPIKLDSGSGTTEPIFRYLRQNNIPFRELIHRRLAR